MTYREAVLQLADRARQALPTSGSRIDKAVMLCLHGHVEVVEGQYRVHAQCNGTTVYHLVNNICPCGDFTSGRAPQGLCKHRLCANIHRKALDMIKEQEPASPPSHSEAPCSVNVRLPLSGREIQLTLRDTSESRLLARLADVLAQFPINAPSVDHEDHLCPIHKVDMPERQGKYGKFRSHKVGNTWCTGKG